MRTRNLISTVVVALAGLAAWAVPAIGAPGYAFVPPSFSPNSLSIGVAVDNSTGSSTGDVYDTELEGGLLAKFDAMGEPVSFTEGSGAGTNMLAGGGFGGGLGPWALAVDSATGNLYVSVEDPAPGRIDEFNSAGLEITLPSGAFEPVVEAGGPTAEEVASYEPSGVAVDDSCYYQKLSEPACKAADPSNGDVYVADRHGSNSVLYRFTAEGAYLGRVGKGQLSTPVTLAVDSSGNVLVANQGNNVEEFSPTGAAMGVFGQAQGSNAVAVDHSTGDVYVYEGSPNDVVQYSSTGAEISHFGGGIIGYSYGIAVSDSTHTVYVSNLGPGEVLKFELGEKPETPVTGPAEEVTASTAKLNGTLTRSSEYYFQYNTNNTCEAAGGATTTPQSGSNGPVSTIVRGLQPSQHYTFCLFATNAFGASEGSAQSFTTAGASPSIDGESFSGLTSTDATLEAQLNPNNQETKYFFQYATNEALTGATIVPGGTLTPSFGDQSVSGDIGGGLTPGETYYYRVIAENATGTSEGTVQSLTTIGPPVVSGQTAQSPTRTTIILSSNVDPKGAATTYHFEYIDQAGYQAALAQSAKDPYAAGRRTENAQTGSDFATHPTGVVLIGELLPGTTYHYALVATNDIGATIGPDQTFTTNPPTPPGAQTGPVSNIAQTTATITATINSKGLATSYGFEIGTNTEYGLPTANGSVGAGSTGTTVTLNLTGLSPGTTYYYRVGATNIDGASHGEGHTFTTTLFANTPSTPLTSLPFLAVPAIEFPTEGVGSGGVAVKALTRSQKLTTALKACKKKPRSKRAKCEKQARNRYRSAKTKR